MTPSARPPLVLASASPRRRELLRQIGIEPDTVIETAVDESLRARELPRVHARRLAREKLDAALNRLPPAIEPGDAFVIAADTVVACGRRILPKAESAGTVADCLSLLSGRRHQVMTAVALAAPGGRIAERLVLTRVQFRRLTVPEIEAYVESREGEGKAGGYAIQGRAAAFCTSINGSYSNVVGLPLAETYALLKGFGFYASHVL